MENISATNNSSKLEDPFSSDFGIRDKSKEMSCLEIPELLKSYEESVPCRQIHRMPPQLRQKNEKRCVYNPMIISFGPYHHGRPELCPAEEVKYRFLDRLASSNSARKNLLYNRVLGKIDEIRGCYADNCVNGYDDRALALMMLLDTCFIVTFMKGVAGEKEIFLDWHCCLGVATLRFAIRDMMVLENQIPFQAIKLITSLQLGNSGEELLQKFLNWLLSGHFGTDRSCNPLADKDHILREPPLHILEACRRMLLVEERCSDTLKSQRHELSGSDSTTKDGVNQSSYTYQNFSSLVDGCKSRYNGQKEDAIKLGPSSSYLEANKKSDRLVVIRNKHGGSSNHTFGPATNLKSSKRILIESSHFIKVSTSNFESVAFSKKNVNIINQTYSSVMDLKAKGILFRPSSSYSIKDIKFKSGIFSGQLQLPARTVSSNALVTLSNMIAYEMSPGADTKFEVLSYINFMKSLIQSPADVKELQEKGILINKFQNHKQVVEEFKGMDTFGLDNLDIFGDIKREIEWHCSSKTKTWMADLIHTRFRSPWTVAALLAATFLLCLTFLQTYFTIHPRNNLEVNPR